MLPAQLLPAYLVRRLLQQRQVGGVERIARRQIPYACRGYVVLAEESTERISLTLRIGRSGRPSSSPRVRRTLCVCPGGENKLRERGTERAAGSNSSDSTVHTTDLASNWSRRRNSALGGDGGADAAAAASADRRCHSAAPTSPTPSAPRSPHRRRIECTLFL